jgi:hypothetical protein
LDQPRAESLMTDGYAVSAHLPAYREALGTARARLAKLDDAAWRADLPSGRLWAARALPVGGGGPVWQRTAAWADKTLVTSLAAWAAGRRRAAPGPVAPEVVEPEAKSADHPPAYVEPAPETYHRLAALAEALAAGLRRHDLLPIEQTARLSALTRFCAFLERVSATELSNHSLAAPDRAELAGGADELERLLLAPDGRGRRVSALADLGGQVQAGVGPVLALYVVIPDNGKLYLARGAALSYIECRAEPLDDERWCAMIDEGLAPGQPEWAASFVTANPSEPRLPLAGAPPVWNR